MQIAIVGGGINGVMTAWELARRGHAVQLLERHSLMSGTSSASTKLLHGGLRYLEQGDVRLVYEALQERAWWLKNAPHLTAVVEIFLPIYEHSPRGRITLEIGLTLYDRLAGRAALGKHRWWRVSDTVLKCKATHRDSHVEVRSRLDDSVDQMDKFAHACTYDRFR
ncbi:MAG: FAD-dependent oxidoreductase, partial [Gemmatimonadaceae bacterium]